MPIRAMRLRNPSVSGGDPFFANVVSLLHFNGANGSTTFTDVTGRSWSRVGNVARISTANSKFGGASLILDSAGDNYISTALSSAFSPGPDFTCEAWIYRTGSSAQRDEIFVQNGLASAYSIGLATNASGILQCFIYNSSATLFLLVGSSAVPTGQWIHVAMVKSGTTLRLFQGGIQLGTTSLSGSFAGTPIGGSPIAAIGNNPSLTDRMFDGYIDDFRFTSGVARYTADFTPPTAQFPDF